MSVFKAWRIEALRLRAKSRNTGNDFYLDPTSYINFFEALQCYLHLVGFLDPNNDVPVILNFKVKLLVIW